jgi:hypothetical protein
MIIIWWVEREERREWEVERRKWKVKGGRWKVDSGKREAE